MQDYILYAADPFGAAAALPAGAVVGVYPFISAVGVRGTATDVRSGRVRVSEVGGTAPLNGTHGGKGVTVAVIDTGLEPRLEFTLGRNRIRAFVDFVEGKTSPYDDNGHGTAVTGIFAGSGLLTCGAVRGGAYAADIVALKAIGADGEGSAFRILEAMQWIYSNRKKYNIRVLNLSFGAVPESRNDPLVLGAEALWDADVAVVASAGNLGPKGGTILSPAVSPKIITVGGAEGLGAADFSSRGPAGLFHKPDLLAPAVDVIPAADPYAPQSGTSMAAPQVSAAAALVFESHPDYTPDAVKATLLKACRPLDCDADTCGAGLIDFSTL